MNFGTFFTLETNNQVNFHSQEKLRESIAKKGKVLLSLTNHLLNRCWQSPIPRSHAISQLRHHLALPPSCVRMRAGTNERGIGISLLCMRGKKKTTTGTNAKWIIIRGVIAFGGVPDPRKRNEENPHTILIFFLEGISNSLFFAGLARDLS